MIVEIILADINRAFNCDILEPGKKGVKGLARIAFANCVKKLLPTMSSPKLGKIMGKDHATVLYYWGSHSGLMKSDKLYRHIFMEITQKIKPKRWLCVGTPYLGVKKTKK